MPKYFSNRANENADADPESFQAKQIPPSMLEQYSSEWTLLAVINWYRLCHSSMP